MALTLCILDDDGTATDLSITLDAPRIVIGRSGSCDVQLLDSTVSARHAVIRRQGGTTMIEDEGSTNGIAVGPVQLPPHTPRVLKHGERVRVGQVWLELGFGAGLASTPAEVRAMAEAHLRRRWQAADEDATPLLRIVDGPDAGAELRLDGEEGHWTIGRSRDCTLTVQAPLASRRHVEIAKEGDGLRIRDLGAKRPAELDGTPLCRTGATWPPGRTVQLAGNTVEWVDPIAEVFDDARRAEDRRMTAAEKNAPVPGADPNPVVHAPTEETIVAVGDEERADPTPSARRDDGPSSAWLLSVDAAVALVALALMALSGFGLVYVLGS